MLCSRTIPLEEIDKTSLLDDKINELAFLHLFCKDQFLTRFNGLQTLKYHHVITRGTSNLTDLSGTEVLP